MLNICMCIFTYAHTCKTIQGVQQSQVVTVKPELVKPLKIK